jgi:hypothetical protein
VQAAGIRHAIDIPTAIRGHLLLLLLLLQAIQDFNADVVTAIGMPVPDTGPDSCGCLLSHALDLPIMDIDCGMTFWSGPRSVPQVLPVVSNH